MSFPDLRDNPCSSSHAPAPGSPAPGCRRPAATAADPGWVLPHIMRAGFLLSLTEAPLQAEAAAHLAQARALVHHANAREKAHLEAVQ